MSEASPDIASVLAVLETRRDDLRIAQELIEVLPIPVYFKARDGGAARGDRARRPRAPGERETSRRRAPRDHAGDVRAPGRGGRGAMVARGDEEPPALRRDVERGR